MEIVAFPCVARKGDTNDNRTPDNYLFGWNFKANNGFSQNIGFCDDTAYTGFLSYKIIIILNVSKRRHSIQEETHAQ